MKTTLLRLTIILFAGFISSCDKDEIVPERNLVSSTNVLTRQASELRTFLSVGGFKLDLNAIQYDVDIYTITYTTTYNEQEITASALVSLPKNVQGSVGMVSFQHGTIAAYSQAPTAIGLSSTELILYSALAAPGLIAVVPDLLGFGASKSVLHPYYVEDLTASAVIDALKAARNLASDKGLDFNGKLFLAGYSQGGYATMAAHKSLEEEPVDGLNLVASFPSSGGYDVKAMQVYFFGLSTYSQPFYIAFVAQAYKTTFGWSQPLSDYFNDPYAARIPSLVNGSLTNEQINAQLTNNIPGLVKQDLLLNIDTQAKYKHLVDAFNENSLTDWKPTIPMFMYHGDADVTVPYQNSVTTYNKLLASGASTSVVTLTALPGKDHGSGVLPYIEAFIPKMLQLK
jgi:pimeloyl-ACP methyl ester carboxylesterase